MNHILKHYIDKSNSPPRRNEKHQKYYYSQGTCGGPCGPLPPNPAVSCRVDPPPDVDETPPLVDTKPPLVDTASTLAEQPPLVVETPQVDTKIMVDPPTHIGKVDIDLLEQKL